MANTINTIQALYVKCGRNYYGPESQEKPDVQTGQNAQENFNIKELDSLGRSEQIELASSIANLPPELTASELKKEVLVWAWTKLTCSDTKDNLKVAMSKCGIDQEILSKSKFAAYRLHKSNDISTIMKTYDLLHDLNDSQLQKIDLPFLLKLSAINKDNFSEKRVKDYNLTTISFEGTDISGWITDDRVRKSKDGQKIFNIYLDAPLAIGLMYRVEPNALTAISPKDAITFFISQIQGVVGRTKKDDRKVHSRGLMPLNWEQLLVRIGEDIAKKFNFEKIGIASAKNNVWLKCFPKKRAARRYDKTAEGLGYLKGKDGNYYKSIEMISKAENCEKQEEKIPFWSKVWPLRYFKLW